MTLTIGFLGFGEVGSSFARGLRDEGGDVRVLAYDAAPPGSDAARLVASRAQDVGVRLVGSAEEIATASDAVFSAVPSSFAVEAAASVREHLGGGAAYYDLTASHPRTKAHVADLLGPVPVADLAIVGPVRVLAHRVPILASGRFAAGHLEALGAVGMDIDVVSDEAGDASAIKLCRSVFTKGIEALLVETLMAAESLGVSETVLTSIEKTLASQRFPAAANRYVTGNAIHAGRRVHEVEDVIALLEAQGVEPLATRGTLERMRRSASSGAREHFGGIPPERYEAVVSFYAGHERAHEHIDDPEQTTTNRTTTERDRTTTETKESRRA